MYDATVTAIDPEPSSSQSRYDDPVLGVIRAPLSSAMTDLYARVLHWRVEEPYQLLNGRVNSRWDWGGSGRSSNEIVSDLRALLAADPKLRVLITHGASDLVTPYFETQMILDQMPAFATPDRLKFAVYGGGHMFYARDASRRALREDAQQLIGPPNRRRAVRPSPLRIRRSPQASPPRRPRARRRPRRAISTARSPRGIAREQDRSQAARRSCAISAVSFATVFSAASMRRLSGLSSSRFSAAARR